MPSCLMREPRTTVKRPSWQTARNEQTTKEATQNAVGRGAGSMTRQDLMSKFPCPAPAGHHCSSGGDGLCQDGGGRESRRIDHPPTVLSWAPSPCSKPTPGKCRSVQYHREPVPRRYRLSRRHRPGVFCGRISMGTLPATITPSACAMPFGQWRRVLAGQTWSAFVDTNATPEEVDSRVSTGVSMCARARCVFTPDRQDFELMLSLEDPNPQIQNGNGVTRVP